MTAAVLDRAWEVVNCLLTKGQFNRLCLLQCTVPTIWFLGGVFCFVLLCFCFSTVGVVVLLVLFGSCCFLVFSVVCFVSLACVYVCVRACVRACMRACVCVCVCVCECAL